MSYTTHIPIKLDVIPGAAAVAAATAAAIAATNMIAKQRKSLISKFETKRPSAPSRLPPPGALANANHNACHLQIDVAAATAARGSPNCCGRIHQQNFPYRREQHTDWRGQQLTACRHGVHVQHMP